MLSELSLNCQGTRGTHKTQSVEVSNSYKIKGKINADDTTLMAESEEELQSLLMKVKEESEKLGLKLNIWKPSPRAANCASSPAAGPQVRSSANPGGRALGSSAQRCRGHSSSEGPGSWAASASSSSGGRPTLRNTIS